MLRISKKQMHAFLTGDESRFIAFLLTQLRRECRDLVRDIDPESLREMVVNGLVRARSHGLNSATDLTAFVSIMFEIAPNFDEQPDIRRALQDESVPRESRFSVMLERVPEGAWEEAERNRRMEAWFPELLVDEGQSS
jgi:predicted nuclease with TOPRIM domain